MHFLRFLITVGALWMFAVSACLSQAPGANRLEEKLHHADELQDKGALQESRSIYESVQKTVQASGPSQQLGHALNGLSNIASSQGNYEEAVQFAREAGDVYRNLRDARGRAFALNSQGIAEGELGLYADAQASFHQALALVQGTGDLETTVRTLNNLGNAYYFPGKYLEALHAYQEAWRVVERSSGQKWSVYWRQITQINQATLYQRLGRYQNALDIYRHVGSGSQGLSPSDRAHLLTNLGALYRRLGDPWKALESYRFALDLYARQHDADGEISVLKNIGIVYALDQGDLRNAEQIFRRALSRAGETHNQREEMQAHLYLGETFLRKQSLIPARDEFQLALGQAKRLDTREEQWKALYGRGQVEQLSGDNARAESDYREAIGIIETTRAQLQLSALRAEFLADKRDAYDAVIALLLRRNDVPAAFGFLERSRARSFQDRLTATPSAGRGMGTPGLSLDEVRSYLDPSTLLLEFWVSGDQLALIWCTHDAYGATQARISPSSQQTLFNFLKTVPDNLDENWRQQLSFLGEIIPGGIPALPRVKHLLIVPDGWLGTVPFDLVPAGENSNTLLIDRFDISYLPTAALLRRVTVRNHRPNWPWTRELVAFGDPTVRDATANPDELETTGNLRALRYSADEIRHIASMARGTAELLLGPLDKKSEFVAGKANSAPLLHVSTHAFADADNPEGSRIVFSSEDPAAVADYLFLRELYDLNLSGVNLATLSACDTERGKMIRGEGVQAFSRALLFAGSKSALTTLWKVDDQLTAEFMKQFYYFALQRGQSKAQALRSAKLRFLHSGSSLANPAHWAAFVLNGDGIEPLPAYVSWRQMEGGVTAALAILALSAWFLMLRRRRRIDRVHRAQDIVAQ